MCYSGRCKYEGYMGDCMNFTGQPCLNNEKEEELVKGLEYYVFYTEKYDEAKNNVYNKVKSSLNNDYDIDKLIEDEIKIMYLLNTIQNQIYSYPINFKNKEKGKKELKIYISKVLLDSFNNY